MIAMLRPLVLTLALTIFTLSLASATKSSKKYIVSGAPWLDTDGNVVNAHGGGIVQSNGTLYWIGGDIGSSGGTNLYSSPDLVTWTNHGTVYNEAVSRPKLIWSKSTSLWHIFGQVNRQMNIASSPNITGPYTTEVVPFSLFGANFTDFGLFQDTDGEAYALYSADHNNLVISLISADRTNVTEMVYQFPGVGLEAPGMFKDGDIYYLTSSHKTAYLCNNDVLYTARNLTGPWSVQSYVAPFGTRTWNSQNTFALQVPGSESTVNIFMGDRWVYPDLPNSTYVWLPVTVNAETQSSTVEWHDVWEVDVETGKWSAPEGTKYEAEKGEVSGKAYVANCPTCSGNQIVTGISSTSTLTISNIAGSGEPEWVAFHYVNTDGLFGDLTLTDPDTLSLVKQRNATVTLNDGSPLPLAQYDTNSGIVMSVPLQLNLTKGSGNTITIGAVAGQSAADLDFIVVY